MYSIAKHVAGQQWRRIAALLGEGGYAPFLKFNTLMIRENFLLSPFGIFSITNRN